MRGLFFLIIAFAVAPIYSEGAECFGIRAKDGDTIHVERIDLGWGVSLYDQDVRLLGFDAPEVSRRRRSVKVTDEEIERGRIAEAALGTLLMTGTVHLYPDAAQPTRDNYGRLLGRLFVHPEGHEPVDVAEWMIKSGHIR